MSGPLDGVAVVEIASIGPGPFSAMVLGDLGAQVVRVERVEDAGGPLPLDPLLRSRSASIALNLKHPKGARALLRLVERSDVLIEGFRPGVMEAARPRTRAVRRPQSPTRVRADDHVLIPSPRPIISAICVPSLGCVHRMLTTN